MRNVPITVVALLLTAACTSLPAVSWRDFQPSGVILSEQRYHGGECPSIAGIYSTRLTMSNSNDGKNYSLAGSVDYLKNIHPKEKISRAPVADRNELEKLVRLDTFVVTQGSEKSFTVLSRDKDGGPLLGLAFSSSASDYTCKDGWIELSTIHYGYNSEGTSRAVTRNIRLTKSIDGALVYDEMTHTNQSSLLIYKESFARWTRSIYPRVADLAP